jgi:DNA polymerase
MDIYRGVQQHLELDAFLTGFTLRSQKQAVSSSTPVADSTSSPINESLHELAVQIKECRKCDLGSTRKNAVPGEGNPQARLIFVGEAPGADEDIQGRPFVGRAGQLLERIIRACGMERCDVYIGNVLKCRPPENRDPRPDEIVCCLSYLRQQIDVIKPDVIVALGAHAARTLLNTNRSIGQLRGTFHDYPLSDGTAIKVMATYHPAYLLRYYSQDNRRRVWEDMKKVLEELGLPIPEAREE